MGIIAAITKHHRSARAKKVKQIQKIKQQKVQKKKRAQLQLRKAQQARAKRIVQISHMVAAKNHAMHMALLRSSVSRNLDFRIAQSIQDAQEEESNALTKPVIIKTHQCIKRSSLPSKGTKIKTVKIPANLVSVIMRVKMHNIIFKAKHLYLECLPSYRKKDPKSYKGLYCQKDKPLGKYNHRVDVQKYNAIMDEFTGDQVKHLRLKLHFTQAEMAAIIGVSPSTLSMIEQDKRKPSKIQNNILHLLRNPTVAYHLIIENLPKIEHTKALKPHAKHMQRVADFLKLQH